MKTDIRTKVDRLKKRDAFFVIATAGAVLAFVAGFGKNLVQICQWLTLCDETVQPLDPRTFTLAKLSFGQHRNFIEQPSLLGPPLKRSPETTDPNASPILETLGYRGFPPEDGENEFATYSRDGLRYIVQYDRESQTMKALVLEFEYSDEKCEINNLRNFHQIGRALGDGPPICLGLSSFRDMFRQENGKYLFAEAHNYVPDCSGYAWTGAGLSGRHSSIEIDCGYQEYYANRWHLNWRIKAATYGTRLVEQEIHFSNHSSECCEASTAVEIAKFVDEVGDFAPDFIAILPNPPTR